MSTHYAILADFVDFKRDPMFLDVATEQAPGVLYTITPTTSPAVPVVQVSDAQFATSPDLSQLASASPALVVATTSSLTDPPFQLNVPSTAVLRMKKVILPVPPMEEVVGTSFNFPMGSLGLGAWLLIANPGTNQGDSAVVVIPSSASAPVNLVAPLNGVVTYQLPPESASARVVISSPNSVPLFVQLAVLVKDKEQAMVIIPPTAP